MYDNRDHLDFGNADIPKLFRSIFVPTLLGMLFNMAFLLTDGIFIGHGIGAYGLASVNLIGPIMMVINGTGMMFGIGASVVAAIHLAQNNVKAARINVTQAFMAAAAIGALMLVIFYLFPNATLRLLGVSAPLFVATRTYYLWFIPTCVLLLIETLGLFVIRLDGSPVYAMLSNIIPAMANILFDYLFIFPCRWGLAGAALATDLGGLIGVGMVGYYMLFRAKSLKLYRLKSTATSIRLSLRNVVKMAQVGFSGFVGELAMAVLMMTGNIMFGRYLGDDGIAAFSVACYLFPLIFMTYSAIAQSAQPIISFNHGAGNRSRVWKTLRHIIFTAMAMGAAVTLAFVLLAPVVIRIFITPDSASYALAARGLPFFAAGFVFMAVNLCTIGYLQGVARNHASTLLTLLRGVVFMAAAFVVLPHWMGTVGLWLAEPAAELLTLLVILAAWGLSRGKMGRSSTVSEKQL
ncbi:MAG: MATE family efflux transporter [Bacteroidales bacterium]|nr:MATE family efflux transporter [Bacteroidales bacterium]